MRAYQTLSESRSKALVISVPTLLSTGGCLDARQRRLARNLPAAVAQSLIPQSQIKFQGEKKNTAIYHLPGLIILNILSSFLGNHTAVQSGYFRWELEKCSGPFSMPGSIRITRGNHRMFGQVNKQTRRRLVVLFRFRPQFIVNYHFLCR